MIENKTITQFNGENNLKYMFDLSSSSWEIKKVPAFARTYYHFKLKRLISS